MNRTASRLVALGLLCATSATAQQRPADSLLVRSLTFRSIGPAVMSGRVVDIAVAENPPSVRGGRLGTVIYIAAATGGVWKSTNAGTTWSPIFDSIRVGGVGAVAVAPSNSEIVWVGSGEPQNMRSSSWGIGVYKSTDGGRTWSGPMLPNSQHVGRIVIDPRDPNVVYVASAGPLWGPGGERGLYKTTDGGRTWTNTRQISQYTGFIDLSMDPSNPDVLYAAAYQRERRAYSFLPAGPESAIYKTTDAGRTWTQLKEGLPSGDLGRIGVSVCRSKPATVYAVIHARGEQNGVYRSDDAGATWRHLNATNPTAWYYAQIICDPTDPEHVVRLNASSQESWDGGRTWTGFAQGGGVHGDHHALWINPETPEQMILGNDGGLDISWDRGRTWGDVGNLPLSQFYTVFVDDALPHYNVYGGLQDNSTYAGPNRTRNAFGPTNADWFRMAGGDGFYNVPDPSDHNIVYAESQMGNIVRYDARIGQTKGIRPIPKTGETHRYNWSAPILPSRHTPGTVYFAANYLFKSPDRGDSWQTISTDLTRAIDRNVLPMRGAVPDSNALGRHEGTTEFGNITSIDESPIRPGLLVVGTDDGLIQVTRDGGRTWTKTDKFPGVPDTTYVSRVIFSKAAEGTIYATFDGHRSNDFKPYILKSANYGGSWTSVTGDLPDGGSVQVVREHHRTPNLLFAGTEFGVFFTVDGGSHWTQLKSGIPASPVHDLVLQTRWNDLVIGTHGRGFYILDDVTPLEHLARAKQAATAYLFPVADALLFQPNGSRGSGMGANGFVGQNPPPGAKIAYMINEVGADAKLSLTIVDAVGTVVRQLPVSRAAGMYRPVWDMRVGPPLTGPVTAADTTPALQGRGGRGGGGGGGGGRGGGGGDNMFLAVTGMYKARLTVTPGRGAPTVLEQTFALTKDPMVVMADVDLRQLYQSRLAITRMQRDLRDRQTQADSGRRTMADVKRASDIAAAALPQAVKDEVAALDKELNEITAQLGAAGGGRGGGGGGGGGGRAGRTGGAAGARGAGGAGGADDDDQNAPAAVAPGQTIQARLGTLNDVLGATFNPTVEQRKTLQSLPTALQAQTDRLNRVRTTRLPALLKTLKDAGIEVKPGA